MACAKDETDGPVAVTSHVAAGPVVPAHGLSGGKEAVGAPSLSGRSGTAPSGQHALEGGAL